MKAFTEGFLLAVLVLVILLGILMLGGCASGVRMDDDERRACRSEGCTAWTDAELRGLVNRAGSAGYRKGWTDANEQAGRGM